MDKDVANVLQEMLNHMIKREEAQNEYQQHVLDELKRLNRTLEKMLTRASISDL